jgi:hypothetical protein
MQHIYPMSPTGTQALGCKKKQAHLAFVFFRTDQNAQKLRWVFVENREEEEKMQKLREAFRERKTDLFFCTWCTKCA